MTKQHRPSKAALPRRRSAGALSLRDPKHRPRVIPDKRREATTAKHIRRGVAAARRIAADHDWSPHLCPEGHNTLACSEPDNVFCPTCNTHYDPRA